MKVLVSGVKQTEGNAKATGNPFCMTRVFALVPIEPAAGKIRVQGFGYEVAEMELAPEALPAFNGMRFPCQLELEVDQKFLFGEFRSIVVGVKAPVGVKAVQA